MKFGKLLSKTSDDMPEMHELFLRYKLLKKLLKSIPNNKEAGEQASAPAVVAAAAAVAAETAPASTAVAEAAAPTAAAADEEGNGTDQVPAVNNDILSDGEQEFIKMLNEDLSRLNQFFIDKEEESVIRLQLFADQLQAATVHEQLQQIKTTLVHFHGEMVLMLHWSLLNYAAVVKILKKHDKRTGLLLRAPYLSSVLQQPFYSTSIMSRLVKRAEDLAQQSLSLTPHQNGDGGTGSAPTTSSAEASTAMPRDEHVLQLRHQTQLLKELQESANHLQEAATGGDGADSELMAVAERLESQNAEVNMFRKTRLALETWAMLGRTASTPSTVLPTNAHMGDEGGQDVANASVAGDSIVGVGRTVSTVTGSAVMAARVSRQASEINSDGTAPGGASPAERKRTGSALEGQEEGQEGRMDSGKKRQRGSTPGVREMSS